ncbi:alcohol dehydrogenase catalytic domain-containing protein [Bacillus sonorensis]|nr:alcohol dehydrogenase catalytic domain-containing protein [Bacillus sonorensis]
MKAAVMTKPFSIVFQDLPRPEPGGHEVLVKVKAAGICGSDVHFYDGSNPYAQYPQIFGHELSGIIEKTGAQVKGRSPGERVVIEPAIPCGSCYPCRKGRMNACVNIDMIGSVRRGDLRIISPSRKRMFIPFRNRWILRRALYASRLRLVPKRSRAQTFKAVKRLSYWEWVR